MGPTQLTTSFGLFYNTVNWDMKLIETQEANGDIYYKFGSTKMKSACVVLKAIKGIPILFLEKLHHNVECINGNINLERGKNGTYKMLYSVLAFVDKYFKGYETIQLQDSSQIQCGKDKSDLINLSNYKMMTKGKTWYQGVIDNIEPKDYIVYEHNIKILKSTVDKEYNDVIKYIKKQTMYNHKFNGYFDTVKENLFETTYKNHYNKKSCMELFNKLDTLYECEFYLNTLGIFMDLVTFINMDGRNWIFNIKDQKRNFEDISVLISKPLPIATDFVGGYRIAKEEKKREWDKKFPKIKYTKEYMEQLEKQSATNL
jgi:hypothetical protein